jgi:hypothetical protein
MWASDREQSLGLLPALIAGPAWARALVTPSAAG